MQFNPNSLILFLLAGAVIVFVIAQSLFFLIRSWKRGKELGMDVSKMKKTIISSAVFTIAPAVSILLGIITLSKFLGLPLPWLRLSVIGAITYELPAATSTANALGVSLSETVTDPKVYTAICWVMTLGIFPGLIWVPLFIKKIQGGLMKMKGKDEKWGTILMDGLFLGMISAFMGMVFANIRSGLAGWIPIFVLLFSALLMAIVGGLLVKKCGIKWLQDYAIPISLLGGMAFAAVITPLIGGM